MSRLIVIVLVGFLNLISIPPGINSGYNMTEVMRYLPDAHSREIFRKNFYLDSAGRIHRRSHKPSAVDPWLLKYFYPDEAGHLYPIKDFRSARFFFSRKTRFLLYTKGHSRRQILRRKDPESIRRSRFDKNNPTKIIIHGFRENAKAEINKLLRDAYFSKGEYNVIVVEWDAGSFLICYLIARGRVEKIGRSVSTLINTLVKATEISPSSIELIGFSLGAHVAGNAGKFQKGKIGKIYALDPSGVFFTPSNRDCVKKTDAQIVEVIHTSCLGLREPIGTVDFYMNSAFHQPGCSTDIFSSCSHQRAYRYFAESVTSTVGFWGKKCQKMQYNSNGVGCDEFATETLQMGERDGDQTGMDGNYLIETNNKPSFSQGKP
ncbi:phospholipase A1 1-like [Uranotaenia lowii]|uniref:phospholipase A1 1-like n=1 Tax=Uranotaenia lowii TaxID=190385 RepID=UPI002479967B|nr:phospholipase A1 1-like [Uranotaenia lowii]